MPFAPPPIRSGAPVDSKGLWLREWVRWFEDLTSNVTTALSSAVWGTITGTLSDQSDLQSALNAKVPTTRTVNGHALSANVTVSKSDVGLGNCDNTSDANKPVSTATQTALDAKVDENGAIVGATNTKITYDAKGLVTSGADAAIADITGLQTALDGKLSTSATTADVADSADKRYVTDAQQGWIPVGGSASTRNAVRTAYPSVAIGTWYLSTGGRAYLKVANAGADTDWERATLSAAD